MRYTNVRETSQPGPVAEASGFASAGTDLPGADTQVQVQVSD